MNFLRVILGFFLKPLLDFFQQRQESISNREQAERLAREAAAARVALETNRKSLDNAKIRKEIDESVSRLSDTDLLNEL